MDVNGRLAMTRTELMRHAHLHPDEKSTRAPAGFGPYLIRAARRGVLDAAKDLLFEATNF
jgi:hypothetical protein